MSRTFIVGDIVNATSPFNEVTEKPVTKIGKGYIMVAGIWWRPKQVTLVQTIAIKPYKDQFTKWKRGCLVTFGAETVTEPTKDEKKARRIANRAIKRMMER